MRLWMISYDELLEEIEKMKDADCPVIVEGKKDKKSLEALGIRTIFTLDKPLYSIVEKIAYNHEKCIILTDLDKKGRQLYRKINADLSTHGVHVNNRFREFLFRKTKLRQIEGLVGYIRRMVLHAPPPAKWGKGV